MHGDYRKTMPQKWALSSGHALIVAVVIWLLLDGGLAACGLEPGNPGRRALLAIGSSVYLIRFLVSTFGFIRRSIDWSEMGIVLPWLAVIHLAFAVLGGTNQNAIGVAGFIGIGLYVLGSVLNTASEYGRLQWKRRNPGRLYTGGFFRLSRHVNYFGDSVLFTGFALLTGIFWALLIPAVMTMGFLFQHVPELEKYLDSRYGKEFRDWALRTAKFVPFLY